MSSNKLQINVSNSQNESINQAVEYLLELIASFDAVKKDFISIGLTGGSLIKLFSNAAVAQKEKFLKYSSKLKFFFADERFVPFSSTDSTYKCYVDNQFFDQLNIPAENVYAIKADADNVSQCADDYEQRLSTLLNSNRGFDILILGHGPDGHICSLFPGHRLFTEEQSRVVVPIDDSPKPPPQRVTITMPIVNNSSQILFCSYGESKAEIIRQIVNDRNDSLPAAAIKPTSDDTVVAWFIDKDAAKLLNFC